MSSNLLSSPVAQLPIQDLIAAIGSDCLSPGCGAAASITLALAAACASKAVAISLKHSPDDRTLQQASTDFRNIARRALVAADKDSEAFERFMREKTEVASDDLVEAVEKVEELAQRLLTHLSTIDAHIEASVKGDVTAASALAHAARTIERRNVAETKSSTDLAAD